MTAILEIGPNLASVLQSVVFMVMIVVLLGGLLLLLVWWLRNES